MGWGWGWLLVPKAVLGKDLPLGQSSHSLAAFRFCTPNALPAPFLFTREWEGQLKLLETGRPLGKSPGRGPGGPCAPLSPLPRALLSCLLSLLLTPSFLL